MTRGVIRNSEGVFRALIEYSTHAVILLLPDGTVIYANPFTEQVIGYKAEEFEEMNATYLIHPSDLLALKTPFAGLLEKAGDFLPLTLRIQHKNGNWCWIEGTIRNCLQVESVGALVVSFQDITVKKQTEEQLKQSEERYRIIFEQASDGIYVADQRGNYVEANAAGCAITGYSREELLTKTIWDLAPDEDYDAIAPAFRQLMTEESRRTHWRLKRKDGSLVSIELHANPLSNGDLMGVVRDISINTQVEEERMNLLDREREARADAEAARMRLYQLFMRAPADIVIMEGPEHRIEMANPRFLKTIGRSEAIGQTVAELAPEITSQGYGEILNKVYTTGIPFIGQECSIFIDRLGNGKLDEGFFNVVFEPFRNIQGQIEGVMIHSVEVTEQVLALRRVEELVRELQAEREALRNAEQKAAHHAQQLSVIFETMTDGVIVVDKNGRIVQLNAATRTFMGLPLSSEATVFNLEAIMPDRLLPHDIDGKLLPLEKWPIVRVLHGESFSSNKNVDVVFYSKEGQPLFFNVSGAPVFDDRGKIVGGLIVLRDVTKRRHLEQQLRYSELKLRSLVDSNVIGVAVVELGGHILEVNDHFVSMLEYSRDELLDSDFYWKALTPPALRAEEERVIKMLITNGSTPPRERFFQRKNGGQFPALVTSTIIDQKSRLAMVLFLDISDRQAAEKRKQEFLSMVSHELRTPLTGIVGFLDLALFSMRQLAQTATSDQEDSIQQLQWLLEQADQHAAVETRMVEALLDVALMEQHTFKLSLKVCDLAETVRDVVLAQIQISEQMHIMLQVPPLLKVPVIIDEVRIKQVIINYLTNALKYTEGDKEITVGLEVTDTVAQVYVRDQGPGLTEEQQAEVWERFYQTDPTTKKGGLGLGLYIAKILITQHHGEVGVESKLGKGATFWFTLPVSRETKD